MFAGFKNLKTHPKLNNHQHHGGTAAPPHEQN